MKMLLKFPVLALLILTLTACNGNNLALDSVDPRPSVKITSNVESITSGQSILIKIAFSKAVTGFDSSEILVTGGSVQNFSGSGAVYTCTIIPNSSAITIQILSEVAIAASGHLNRASEIKSLIDQATTVSNENSATCFNTEIYRNKNLGLEL